MEQIQRYQKLMPVGRLVSQGQIYFLIQPDPVQSERRWVDQLGCWEFMVVPDATIEIIDDYGHPVILKSNGNVVHPSPRPIVVTSFLIEWGNQDFPVILALPTEEYEVA